MVLLSVTGVFRTLLIFIGIFVLLRFIGKLMVAKRNVDEHEKLRKQERESDELVDKARRNFGKTSISKIEKSTINPAEFTDFEEIDEN